MSDQERGEIMEALSSLPEEAKQFMLGFAAGRSAAQDEQKRTDGKETDERSENVESC